MTGGWWVTRISSVKRNFWPIGVCQLFCFPEQRKKVWRLLFWCVLCKLKLFGEMSSSHKLQHGNNYNYWKILDLVLDLNYFSFSKPNPAHLLKHQTLSPNHRPVATMGIRRQCPPKFFLCPPNIVVTRTCFIKTNNKNKNLAPLKIYIAPPNFETWLGACLITISFRSAFDM